jgi:hypothetical protein
VTPSDSSPNNYKLLMVFNVVFPLVQKNHIHSSCVVQQQTGMQYTGKKNNEFNAPLSRESSNFPLLIP